MAENTRHTDNKSNPFLNISGVTVGDGTCRIIAGPCAVESREQVMRIARAVKEAGADMLRGGAFKPRTSPYAFQGLGRRGLEYLLEAGRETHLPVVSEIMSVRDLELFTDVDMLQVGARNMQNFELLRELGHSSHPVLLKRGAGSTLEELLLSAEYILSGGNRNVMLCERGIRTFNSYSRNTLDLTALPALHGMTTLPVCIDPSHATGRHDYVAPMALAAAASGADCLMVEVHDRPEEAMSDGAQALRPSEFSLLVRSVRAVENALRAVE